MGFLDKMPTEIILRLNSSINPGAFLKKRKGTGNPKADTLTGERETLGTTRKILGHGHDTLFKNPFSSFVIWEMHP